MVSTVDTAENWGVVLTGAARFAGSSEVNTASGRGGALQHVQTKASKGFGWSRSERKAIEKFFFQNHLEDWIKTRWLMSVSAFGSSANVSIFDGWDRIANEIDWEGL